MEHRLEKPGPCDLDELYGHETGAKRLPIQRQWHARICILIRWCLPVFVYQLGGGRLNDRPMDWAQSRNHQGLVRPSHAPSSEGTFLAALYLYLRAPQAHFQCLNDRHSAKSRSRDDVQLAQSTYMAKTQLSEYDAVELR
jgi:hypothetical protein